MLSSLRTCSSFSLIFSSSSFVNTFFSVVAGTKLTAERVSFSLSPLYLLGGERGERGEREGEREREREGDDVGAMS